MQLSPKKSKYRKEFKGVISGCTKNAHTVAFGIYGLKAMTSGRITSAQIESARKAVNGYLKRAGKLFIRIFPNVIVTKKPADVRMGSGKGQVEYYAFKAKIGRMLFELDGVSEKLAKEAFRRATAKLPILTKVVVRIDGE